MNNFTKWWEWMKIFLEILYSISPNEKEARRAAGLSEKRCKTLEKITGVRFVKPIRKFWGLKAWPEHFISFLYEHAKFLGRHPPFNHHHLPHRLRHRDDPSRERRDGEGKRWAPEDVDYGAMASRKVNRGSGGIYYQGAFYIVSTVVGGWSVGLSPREDGLVEVWFSKLLLGHLDPTSASIRAARPGGPEAGQPDQQMCHQ